MHWVDQAWKVYYYSCIPTLFFSGSFHRLEGGGEVFAEFFSFLFDNT